VVLQWCEVCHQLVDDVEPARLRGRHLMMVCLSCRRHFEGRIKVQWGKYQFQYFWDLGASKVPLAGRGPRRPYLMSLTKQQVAWMSAAGYTYTLREEEDEDSADEGQGHEEH